MLTFGELQKRLQQVNDDYEEHRISTITAESLYLHLLRESENGVLCMFINDWLTRHDKEFK